MFATNPFILDDIFSRNNFPDRYNYKNEDIPDYTILAHNGWFITTRDNMRDNRNFPDGMHGYDPTIKDMHGIFMASGPSFKRGYKVKSMTNTNVYPIICKIHGLTPYELDGVQNDWDIELISRIMHWWMFFIQNL